jgi:nucleoside-diphosphate-sugar epimerase
VDLATHPECYGEAWNLGGAGEISGADFIQKVYLAAGREPRFRTVGRGMLKLAGIFNPFMRELPEMLYLQETPVILDDSKLRAKLGDIVRTPYDQGISDTLEWMRAKHS